MEHLRDDHSKRNIYIDNQPRLKAIEAYEEKLKQSKKQEEVSVYQSLGRITAQAVFANISSPHYHSAAMDGIAVLAEKTYGANERSPVILKESVDFCYINTGNPVADGYDAVIMIEDVIPEGEGLIKLLVPAHPWQHVRTVGEDIVKGEMIIPSGHKIRAIDIGALLSGGVVVINVLCPVKVGIIPTGNELTRDIETLEKGQIIDSNAWMFQGLVTEAGGLPTVYEPVEDNMKQLEEVICKAINENDFVIVNAGSSAGSKDYTVDIIRSLGEVIVHGIAMKPGKPTILGIIDNKGIIGIPGYPVSAYFSFRNFVEPFIRKLSGSPNDDEKTKAVLSKRIVSSLKHEELVRVTLGKVNGQLIATALNRGAGNTTSLVRADGVLTVPIHVEGIEAEENVEVQLLKPLEIIEKRAVFIGSHDIIIDILSDMMPISSSHVGSFGGLMAKRKGECHIAPIHLMDEATGDYNDAFVKKYFEDGTMSIISGVKRLQGIMVKKGNPKQIKGFADLSRDDVIFVNRQRGSGTRQLLDYELKKQKIDPKEVNGYDWEVNTHMGVAVAVDSNAVDVGLGIYAAADNMGLDFIPVGYEAYEFLVSNDDLNDDRIKKFLEIITSDIFKSSVLSLGGYQLDDIGTIRKIEK
ncbi:molybdopterin biosynthesis protein [Marinisporobacter balticus]|uniref:Molybdopterin molybdenumtransferase n=1 Tax=Marinisporobacter balticus TaxID=2018667 RepID=A0A4R2LDH7_9FIRM|nr:molybdopterin biosynthesis protein [Marinisporobacter balticus]TCO77405.1 molybdopterin molybdochelatase [Marinisporobacter balticus]